MCLSSEGLKIGLWSWVIFETNAEIRYMMSEVGFTLVFPDKSYLSDGLSIFIQKLPDSLKVTIQEGGI